MSHLKGERRGECEQRVCLLGLLQGKATSTKKPSIVSDEGRAPIGQMVKEESRSTNRAVEKEKKRKKNETEGLKIQIKN